MSWREVWGRRTLPDGGTVTLQGLIELDGFDTGAGRVEAADWREYARAAGGLLGLGAGESVYEVGCGGGAFLFALREQFQVRVGGCDYAPGLIRAARRALPEGEFDVLEARDLSPAPTADVVLSNGVFHYFPDLDYASTVLDRMIARSSRAVAVLEVPDLALREAAERTRREKLAEEEYERKYAGLGHLYYSREWFEALAASRGLRCRFVPSPIPNYAQSRFRFGVVMTRS